MNRSEIAALHDIALIENVLSLVEHGLLSYREPAALPHRSVAMEEVQDRLRDKRIPDTDLFAPTILIATSIHMTPC